MILNQYYLGCLAHASYLIGSEEAGTAAVIDPQRDIDQYLEDADNLGLKIEYVFLTHFHADFLAGHLELRDRVGAKIYLGSRAEAEYEFTPMHNEDVLELGDVRLMILETPGHTPESISILVYDLKTDENNPYAILTGDTLFIGDVGRPDLFASIGFSASELGEMLYDSLHNKLLKLPDDTLVYPAHGAGSLCGKNLSDETVSTLGVQRRYNYALQPMSEEKFVQIVTADQPDAPAYFTHDAALNAQEHPTLESTLERTVKPLKLEEVLQLEEQGAQLLDAREPADFAGAHLKGSLNIGLSGTYATWAGTLLDPDRPIVIIADMDGEEEAAMRLGRIGFDNISGYLEGGMQALENREELIVRTERITAPTVAEQLASSEPPAVLDVRTEKEWETGRIEGSQNIPLNRLMDRLNDVPGDRTVVVYCRTGYRSSIAASILLQRGVDNITDMVGGIAAWESANLETFSSV